jgi:hypothetical protein
MALATLLTTLTPAFAAKHAPAKHAPAKHETKDAKPEPEATSASAEPAAEPAEAAKKKEEGTPASPEPAKAEPAKPALTSAEPAAPEPSKAAAAPATSLAAPAMEAPVAPKPAAPKAPAPLASNEPGWQFGFYGWVELDMLWDSTQSFSESVLNQNIARPNTIAGDNPRYQATAKDSRFGYKIAAPAFGALKVSGQFEADFFGTVPSNATQDQSYVYASIRLRQYFAKLETPVLDVLVGQTFDLFGWGGQGFFPNTPAFLGVMGEVFHRNVQLRLSKTLETSTVNVELAAAAVRPATRDSGIPDLQAGLKLTINGWKGASAQGPRPAKVAPLAIGLSGVGRQMSVTDFDSLAGDPQKVRGWGAAATAFIPVLRADGEDLSNTLSLTGELSKGEGISDLYLTLTGGVLFPALPNPKNVLPAPGYTPNIDNGIVTFDADGKARAIQWQGMMGNARYNFPFRQGRALALSAVYSRMKSSNAVSLTPRQGQSFVWDKGQYLEGTLWWSITPAFQLALSYQHMEQTYGDGVTAKNDRGEASWWFFF